MRLTTLYIDREIADHPKVRDIKSRLKIPVEIAEDSYRVFEAVSSAPDPVKRGKEVLFLTKNKGAFIKKCPGTRLYNCCDYKILHIGTFCIMDCSYCILQTYFHPPVLQYFVNEEDLLPELDALFAEKTTCRIGTGEFTDSLIWERWTDLSSWLVPKFSEQSHVVLEIKTKTTAVESLKSLIHNRKTIAAWSLNTEKIIHSEERNTASLIARLQAAAKCESYGYPLAFHFDPLVIYDGCEEDYRAVVKQLFSHVSAENIAWISLGSFRFIPPLKQIIQKRFPASKIVYGEFITGMDGKMRYFMPLRIQLYQKMIAWIRENAPNVEIYFCMEHDDVWKKCLGFVPSDRGGLSKILDESAVKHCGLDLSKFKQDKNLS